jgi:hypothetical protein
MKTGKSASHDPRPETSAGAPAPAPASRGVDSVVCFELAGKTFALDVAVVREVVSVERLRPVPHTPPPWRWSTPGSCSAWTPPPSAWRRW